MSSESSKVIIAKNPAHAQSASSPNTDEKDVVDNRSIFDEHFYCAPSHSEPRDD